MHIWIRTFCAQSSLLFLAVVLAGCGGTSVSQLGSLAQLSAVNNANGSTQAKSGQISIPTTQIVSAVSTTATQAMVSLKNPEPGSPEALHRDEMIARGEIPDPAEQKNAAAPIEDLHAATIDNCPVANADGSLAQSDIPMGISECELLSLKGKPKEIRRLSMPTEPRRLLLSYLNKQGQTSIFEFVQNRLTTVY